MILTHALETKRLRIEPLTSDDSEFILELVNSPGWLQFIGNRHVNSKDEAKSYIQKILDAPDVTYWVVKLKDSLKPLGIVTCIKRDYLEYHDIGYAFLPQAENHGYATESTSYMLTELAKISQDKYILASPLPENAKSIRLLEKLGFSFEKNIEREQTVVQVYKIAVDQLQINAVAKKFFEVFTNTIHQQPDWLSLERLCIPEVSFISAKQNAHTVSNLHSFIQTRKILFSQGALSDFQEYELSEQTSILNNIAQRHSRYEKTGVMEGKRFCQQGEKFLHFIHTREGWKISSVIWEDHAV